MKEMDRVVSLSVLFGSIYCLSAAIPLDGP